MSSFRDSARGLSLSFLVSSPPNTSKIKNTTHRSDLVAFEPEDLALLEHEPAVVGFMGFFWRRLEKRERERWRKERVFIPFFLLLFSPRLFSLSLSSPTHRRLHVLINSPVDWLA